jgi:RNA polymerase subunit RPABC4/transcription elongation factor Spt4
MRLDDHKGANCARCGVAVPTRVDDDQTNICDHCANELATTVWEGLQQVFAITLRKD